MTEKVTSIMVSTENPTRLDVFDVIDLLQKWKSREASYVVSINLELAIDSLSKYAANVPSGRSE